MNSATTCDKNSQQINNEMKLFDVMKAVIKAVKQNSLL